MQFPMATVKKNALYTGNTSRIIENFQPFSCIIYENRIHESTIQ
jgi:hypothetical protein